MEIRLLRSFQALAQQGHFGRAARGLHLSQPALTKQMRQLEEEVGGPLFVRGRHGAQLTSAGKLFSEEVDRLMLHADRVLDRVQRAARGEVGELRLGFGITTRFLVPRLVSRFRQSHPQVHVIAGGHVLAAPARGARGRAAPRRVRAAAGGSAAEGGAGGGGPPGAGGAGVAAGRAEPAHAPGAAGRAVRGAHHLARPARPASRPTCTGCARASGSGRGWSSRPATS